MVKQLTFILLITGFFSYSILLYTKGTNDTTQISSIEKVEMLKGKQLYQKYNCTACHQLYGLGGYLGPELTTTYSNKERGETAIRTFLKNGGPRMPNFNLTNDEINQLVVFLKYVDASAISYKK
jgi:nitric oxide reductase subunit C